MNRNRYSDRPLDPHDPRISWGVGLMIGMIVLALVIIAGVATAQMCEEDCQYYTDTPCFRGDLGWPSAEALAQDQLYLKIRYREHVSGEIIYEGIGGVGRPATTSTIFRVDSELAEGIGFCGFGVWGLQVSMSYPDPENPFTLLLWDDWKEIKVVTIAENYGTRPMPPVIITAFATDVVRPMPPEDLTASATDIGETK